MAVATMDVQLQAFFRRVLTTGGGSTGRAASPPPNRRAGLAQRRAELLNDLALAGNMGLAFGDVPINLG
jgi:hypothetical protein